MAKKNSLAADILAMKPTKRPSFFDACAPKLQAELLELRELYLAGKLPSHASATRILQEKVQPRLPVKISVTTFREWLRGVRG